MGSVGDVLKKLSLTAGVLSVIAFIIYLAKLLFENSRELTFPPAALDFLSWGTTILVAALCLYLLSLVASVWTD